MHNKFEQVDRIEMWGTVVQFYFKDATKMHVVGDPETGTGAIHYTGNRTKDAYKFVEALTEHVRPDTDMFWFGLLNMVHDYITYIYEA